MYEMTVGEDDKPVHVHVDRNTPVHVHLKKKKKGKNKGAPTAVEVNYSCSVIYIRTSIFKCYKWGVYYSG